MPDFAVRTSGSGAVVEVPEIQGSEQLRQLYAGDFDFPNVALEFSCHYVGGIHDKLHDTLQSSYRKQITQKILQKGADKFSNKTQVGVYCTCSLAVFTC